MSNENKKRYFVEEGKSLSTKIGNVAPHGEITSKLIGGENPNKMIEKHLKNGLLYEADKPRIDVAAKVKADKNQVLKDQAGAVEKLELANKKIKHLEDKIKDSGDDAIKSELKDVKKELGEANAKFTAAEKELDAEKTAHGETSTNHDNATNALNDEVRAHGETRTKLDAAEKDFGDEVTAHDATKKELKELKASIKAK